jgi:hypothetical protein
MPDEALGRKAERADHDLDTDQLDRDIGHGGDDSRYRHG